MVRKMFAGGNSARGFYSFFDQMFSDNIEQIFLLKGGPGTGKSHLMKNLAEYASKQGYPVELFYCASDPDSLDGIVLPEQHAGVVDATAPHVQDPVLPGCREEIVNLGDNWDRDVLVDAKGEIAALTRANKQAYGRAYRYLRAAEEIEELWAAVNAQSAGEQGTEKALDILLETFGSIKPGSRRGKERHTFATAITPQGIVSHIDELVTDYSQRWIIRCAPGTGAQEVFSALVSAARLSGVSMEIFHRPLLPHQIEHVLFPDLGVAVLSRVEPFDLLATGTEIDLLPDQHKTEVPRRVKDLYGELLESGIAELKEAKRIHDDLEALYIQALDFARSNLVYETLRSRIFGS